MAANPHRLLLLLAFLGIVGCSSTERLYNRPAQTALVTPSSRSSITITSPITSDATVVTSPALETASAAEPAVTTETEPPPALRPEIPTRVLKSFERWNQPVETQEKSAPPTAPAQAATQRSSDHQLIDLMEKALDRAVEQPRERRRLQFPRQVVEHPKVRHYIQHYTTTAKSQMQTLLGRSGKFMPMISKALSEEGLPEELGYLALVESELMVSATSPVGAVGLWQFVPATARQYGLRIDDWVDERRDPIKSTRAAAAYLKELHSYYGRWFLVTAAYNAGPGTINKALQTSKASDFWGMKQKDQLSQETLNFVPKFVAVALIANDPNKYGFNNIRYEEALEFDEVDAEGLLKISALAEMAESDAATIRELNPALLKNLTPPGEKGYSVRVPVGKALVFAKANNMLKGVIETESAKVVTHEVKRGETLFSIARRYGQAVTTLMQLNGLTTPRLHIGQQIKILLDGIRSTLR